MIAGLLLRKELEICAAYLLSNEGNLSHEAKSSDEVLEGELLEDAVRLVVSALGGPAGDLSKLSGLGVSFELNTRHLDGWRVWGLLPEGPREVRLTKASGVVLWGWR